MPVDKIKVTEKYRNRIFKPFIGMDDEYVKLIQKYHVVFLNADYSQQYKDTFKAQTIDKVKELVKANVEAAKAEIEKIKDENTSKPAPVKLDIAQKTYNLLLWSQTLPVADLEELEELYVNNMGDDDFIKILKTELKRRTIANGKNLAIDTFITKIEGRIGDSRFEEFDSIIRGLNFFISISGKQYPSMVLNGLANIKYRNITDDMAAYPILEGPSYRPVFKSRCSVK